MYLLLFVLFLAVVILTSLKIFLIAILLIGAMFLIGLFGARDIWTYVSRRLGPEVIDGEIYVFDHYSAASTAVFRSPSSGRIWEATPEATEQKRATLTRQLFLAIASLSGALILLAGVYAVSGF
jgi:hypothetical protein